MYFYDINCTLVDYNEKINKNQITFVMRSLVICTPTYFFFLWRCDPTRVMVSSFLRFLDHTQRTTVGRTPLDEWSARRRDIYLTTHYSQQTNNHAPGGIRTHDLSRRAAADLRLRQRGHWDRHSYLLVWRIYMGGGVLTWADGRTTALGSTQPLRLRSRCIRIWPIFCTGVHGRKKNKCV